MELTAIAQWLNTAFAGYDYAILQALHNLAGTSGGVFTPLCYIITLLGEKGLLFLALGIALMLFPKTRKMGICMFGAVCCGALITNFWLKGFVARPRPLTVEPFRTWWQAAGAYAESEYSFPSGHVTAAMAGVTALVLTGKKPARYWAFLFVPVMGFARNYLMAHYPSDVLVAAIIGVASGFIAWVITRFIFSFLEDRRDSMPIAELVLDFDIREVLPFDIPFIGAAPEKESAPAKKAPTIRNRRGPAFETRDGETDDLDESESAPRRSAASRVGSHAKAESAPSQRFKLNLPSMPGAYKGKHEKK